MRRRVILGLMAALAGGAMPGVQQQCLAAGANVSFTTYEAEAGTRGGGATLVTMSSPPTVNTSTPELEASGRAYVRLDANGEYVQWTNVVASNKMTIRFVVPDGTNGGGATYSLAIYVRQPGSSTWVHRTNVSLNSKFAWLYGHVHPTDGQDDNPAVGNPHRFWTDFRFSIPGDAIPAGAGIRLQKDSNNTSPYYYIDLIDLETSPAAVGTPPAGTYIDVTASPYNAVPNDGNNDSAAFQAAVNAAAAANPKKIVWVPTGVYNLSSTVTVDGVEVRGRNHWNTRITTTGGIRGFTLKGNGPKLNHFLLSNDSGTTRSTTNYAIQGTFGNTTNWAVENMWIQHTGAGLWMSNCNNGMVQNNRVYGLFADGINMNRGSSGNTIQHNYVRGTGDDGIAVISEVQNGSTVNPITTNNTVKFNTIRAIYWGSNFALRGGGGHVIEDNLMADSGQNPGINVSLESAYNMNPITSATFRRNELYRCGGNKAGQKRGAIWFNAGNKTMTGLAFHNTLISSPLFRGIHYAGSQTHTSTFNSTTITNPGEDAVIVATNTNGSSTFNTYTITGVPSGFSKSKNNSPSTFTLTPSNL